MVVLEQILVLKRQTFETARIKKNILPPEMCTKSVPLLDFGMVPG